MNTEKVYSSYLRAYAGIATDITKLADERLLAHIMGYRDGNAGTEIKDSEEVVATVHDKLFPAKHTPKKTPRKAKRDLFEE